MDLGKIAEEYRRLAERYEKQAERAKKPGHLNTHIAANRPQAGRLLLKAIMAGGFPKVRRDINGGWWDAETDRVPYPTPMRGGKPCDIDSDDDCALLWTFGLGWLTRTFRDRFRADAAAWDWRHIATDAEGKPVGKDGNTLGSRWYVDGEPIDDKLTQEQQMELVEKGHQVSWKLEGEIANVTDFYDDEDGFEHGRIQAEVHGSACLILAELLERESMIQSLPRLMPGDRVGISREDARLHRLACERATYQAQQWCAIETALEQIEPWAEGQPDPKAARWFALMRAAFDAAVNMAKQLRAKETPGGEEFARAAANLDGLWRQAENEGKAIELTGWPREPASLVSLTGANTLEVALRFTRAVYVETITAAQGNRNAGQRPQDLLPVSDPFYEAMRNRFAAEVNQRLMKPDEWWPTMGAIRKEYGLAQERLTGEYEVWATQKPATEATQARQRQPKGMTQADAAKAATKIVKAEGWIGIKPLAKRIGTTATTMRKAIANSPYLKARRAEHDIEKERKRKPREAGTGGKQPNPASDGDVLDQLIAEQEADDRRDQRRPARKREDRN